MVDEIPEDVKQQMTEEDKRVKEALEKTTGITNQEDFNATVEIAKQFAEFIEFQNKAIAELKGLTWINLQVFHNVNAQGQIEPKKLGDVLKYFGLNIDLSNWVNSNIDLINKLMIKPENAKIILDKLDDFLADYLTI